MFRFAAAPILFDMNPLASGLTSNELTFSFCIKLRSLEPFQLLENEKLFSYCEEENTLFEKLISFDNVVITPHVAGWTFQSFYKIATTILENVDRLND